MTLKKNVITPIAIIIGGLLLAAGMIASKSQAEKTSATAKPILVEAIAFEKYLKSHSGRDFAKKRFWSVNNQTG